MHNVCGFFLLNCINMNTPPPTVDQTSSKPHALHVSLAELAIVPKPAIETRLQRQPSSTVTRTVATFQLITNAFEFDGKIDCTYMFQQMVAALTYLFKPQALR